MSDDSGQTGWAALPRRLVTLPAVALLLVALLPIAPQVTVAALLVDLLRRRRLATARCVLLLYLYLLCEAAGIVASSAIWVAERLGLGGERAQHAYLRLQCWWARMLLRGAARLYDLRFAVAGADSLDLARPLVVLSRHTSIADTLLPAVLLQAPFGLRLRYVIKEELLWDPCIDLVGNRLPNVFVRRGSADSAREIARVKALGESLVPGEGVLIYPEGTRYSAARRARVLEKMRADESPLLAEGEALRHLLPPRRAGTLALLEAAPDADVLFCVHHGFEETRSLSDLLGGQLVGRRIDVEYRRIPRSEIPREPGAQSDWLGALWREADDWLEQVTRGESQ